MGRRDAARPGRRSRRWPAAAVAAVLAAATAVATLALAPAARAAAPMAHAQAPGWYRFTVGAFEVTALNDGTFDLPVGQLLHQPAGKTDAALAKAFLKAPVETSVNGFLVNTGGRLVLVDAGTGGSFGPGTGALLANLKAAGYAPEQVDDILLTHLHPDHVGGLAHDGVAVFPNAVVHAGRADIDHDLGAAALAGAPEAERAGVQAAQAALAPYVAAHRLQPIVADGEVVPGIRAWATPGHTPGHTSYVVESQGRRLIVIGDLIHVAAVQFGDPAVTVAFDSDPASAARQRAKVFAQAARDGTPIAGAHLQFPGVGHLRQDGRGWTFVPANYQRMR